MTLPQLVVWDFDGVLNRNVVDGRFVWSDHMQEDLGLDPERLRDFLFVSGRMRGVVRGQGDLADAVAEWLIGEGSEHTSDTVLDYWFTKDALPDAEVLGWLKASDARHVIGTNNEARRAAFIEGTMGFGGIVEHIFASGRMGVAKPDDGFWEAIEAWSGIAPADILLVDDHAPNVEAAKARGWQGYHFTDDTRAGLPGLFGLT